MLLNLSIPKVSGITAPLSHELILIMFVWENYDQKNSCSFHMSFYFFEINLIAVLKVKHFR